jgi:anti-sigma factor RsiW
MSDQWTSRLSEYLDDELPAGERQALEAHLKTCAVCRQTLAELERVVQRAANYEETPRKDLWPGIARRIGVSVPPVVRDLEERREVKARRRFAFSVPQLAAAAMLVLALGSGGAYLAIRLQPSAVRETPVADGGRPTAEGFRTVAWWDSTAAYDASVAELQEVLATGRTRLDTATVRVLETNLAIIDKAIYEARAALAADPNSPYLSMHLAQTMRTKLELLRRAQAIAVRSS